MNQRWCLTAGLVAVWVSSFACGEEGVVDQTATSPLRELQGFVGEFSGDIKLSSDPRVIFADDFESADFSNWDEHTTDSSIVSLVADPDSDPRVGTQVMRVTATLGENTGGGATKWFQPSDPVFIRYYVKFAADCDYTHHQVRIRANKGLRGRDKWSGFGQAGIRPDGVGRFVTGVEPWGNHGRTPPPGRWSFYTYWPEMKAAPDGKFWGNQFLPASGSKIPRDRWICVELMINTTHPANATVSKPFGSMANCRVTGVDFNGGHRPRCGPILWPSKVM